METPPVDMPAVVRTFSDLPAARPFARVFSGGAPAGALSPARAASTQGAGR